MQPRDACDRPLDERPEEILQSLGYFGIRARRTRRNDLARAMDANMAAKQTAETTQAIIASVRSPCRFSAYANPPVMAPRNAYSAWCTPAYSNSALSRISGM